MLSFLRMRNFMSAGDATLNFTFAEGRAPSGYRDSSELVFCEPVRKVRLVPVMAIYGPNASGKTCIIRALSALREIALGSPAARFYRPNRLLDAAGPMTLTCGFCTGNRAFVYDVTLGSTGITAEILSCDGKEVFCVGCGHDHFDGLTTPGIYTADRLLEIYQTECLGEEGEQRRSFLSRLGSNYPKLSDAAADAHRYLTALEIYPENRFARFSDLERLQNMSWDTFAASLAEIARHLRQFDISIEGLRADRKVFARIQDYLQEQVFTESGFVQEEPLGSYGVADLIRALHQDISGRTVELFLSEESEGTRILAWLLGVMLPALHKGGVLIIDDLDRCLHPGVLEKLVSMFRDRDYNQNNAQLIFTTHDTELLETDTVRMSEVAIVDQTLRKGTSITRIAEFEGIRNVTGFRRQYLLGTFGGIPHPYI